jgi:hypothetical protein
MQNAPELHFYKLSRATRENGSRLQTRHSEDISHARMQTESYSHVHPFGPSREPRSAATILEPCRQQKNRTRWLSPRSFSRRSNPTWIPSPRCSLPDSSPLSQLQSRRPYFRHTETAQVHRGLINCGHMFCKTSATPATHRHLKLLPLACHCQPEQ